VFVARILYCFQSKISRYPYHAYNVPSTKAMVCTMAKGLEHMLLSISHGVHGASKWV
jgi:hypothetical protein